MMTENSYLFLYLDFYNMLWLKVVVEKSGKGKSILVFFSDTMDVIYWHYSNKC